MQLPLPGNYAFKDGSVKRCTPIVTAFDSWVAVRGAEGEISLMSLHAFAASGAGLTGPTVPFAAGDRVRWSYTSRGGYGFGGFADGTIKKVGPANIQIELRERPRYQKNWETVLKWVPPATLAHRALPVETLGEATSIDIDGFRVDAWRHPATGHREFPNGVWYGRIDGVDVTAPASSAQAAVGWAAHALGAPGVLAEKCRDFLRVERDGRHLSNERQALCRWNEALLVKLEAAYPVVANGDFSEARKEVVRG